MRASEVVAVAAGGGHSLFIKSDGSLWAMGANSDGTLGDGTHTNRFSPVQVVSRNVVAASAGFFHSVYRTSDGSLWGMGFNAWGQLGEGRRGNYFSPKVIYSPLQPTLTGVRVRGSDLVLEGSNGRASHTYLTLAGQEITHPIVLWSLIGTNRLQTDGNFAITLTNGVDPNARYEFYRILVQE